MYDCTAKKASVKDFRIKKERAARNGQSTEIRLFDNKMIIVYNSPKTMSLDESQGFSFYTDNVPYPIYIQNMKQPRMIDFQLIMRI